MRILMVNSTLHIGGAERVAACIAERIDSNRFHMTACYIKEPGIVAEQMRQAGVQVMAIPGLRVGRTDYLSFLKLRRLIKLQRVDLIHTHDVHGLADGVACRLSCNDLRHVHTFHFGNYPALPDRYRRIESALWRVPDAIVAVGYAQAQAISHLYRIPNGRLRVIWNGVDEPGSLGLEMLNAVRRRSTGPTIVSISTLIPQKGLECLLDAVALLKRSGKQFQLLIAGEGVLRSSLEKRIEQLGVSDRVTLLGWIPEAASQLLPVCDMFVQSSLWEAMSVVVLEAMAAAKPMVVTSVGENPIVLESEKNALIVPPDNAEALATAIGRILDDPVLASRLAVSARHRYEEAFHFRNMVAAYEGLYSELLTSDAASGQGL